VAPTAAAPCEPGAEALDPDGVTADQGVNGSTVLNLTAQVVVCPPAACKTQGCSPIELRRHLFRAKGLQGCGIDMMAAEGTQFKVGNGAAGVGGCFVWFTQRCGLLACACHTVLTSALQTGLPAPLRWTTGCGTAARPSSTPLPAGCCC
jgi:hypothetical protein